MIDLWKSAPTSPAAAVGRGARGCLTLRSVVVRPGVVVAAGGEHGLFEHRFRVMVRGRNGGVLGHQSVRAVAGRWSATVRYRTGRPQVGATVEAVDFSAKDGALTCLVQARVTLEAPASTAGASVYVTNTSGGSISEYDVGPGGVLTPKAPATVAAPGVSEGIAVSPDGKSVYAASPAGIYQYNVGPGGVLSPKSPSTVPGGNNPIDLAISPDGKSVYATGNNTVSEYDVGPGGALTPKSPAVVAAGNGARGIVVSPDSKSVYVANESDDSVSEYDVGVGGVLTAKSPATIAARVNPLQVAVSPNQTSVYACGGGGISQFDVQPGGVLRPKAPPTVGPEFVSAVAVSRDGKSAYGADPIFARIYEFDVNPDGSLTPKSPSVPDMGFAFALAISPDGKNLYVTNQESNTISEYTTAAGGSLTPTSTISTGSSPRGIAISPSVGV